MLFGFGSLIGSLRGSGLGRRERMAKQNARCGASGFTVSWFAWWALMMSFWVAIDDSLRSDELIVGAVGTALAAAAASARSRSATATTRRPASPGESC